jgi:hypothetical protein
MMRHVGNNEMSDVILDGKSWVLESMEELRAISKLSHYLKGIDLWREYKDIELRLWSEMDGAAQRRYERSVHGKKSLNNFDRHRARGAE